MTAPNELPVSWPWERRVCWRCRASVVEPLATPGYYSVHHHANCPWRCLTVLWVVSTDNPGEWFVRFRRADLDLVPGEPLCGCRRCSRRVEKAINQAAARHDSATVLRLDGAR